VDNANDHAGGPADDAGDDDDLGDDLDADLDADLEDGDYIDGFIAELEDGEDDGEPTVTVAKPDELLALHTVTTELFSTLRRWFSVPAIVPIDLQEIDSAVGELGDPVMIAALAMRKLQALHLLSTPGVMTTTDVVITIVQDLDRALVQAPNMRLKLQAAGTDWDAAFAALAPTGDASDGGDASGAAGEDTGVAAPFDPVMDDDPSFGTSHPSRRPDAGAPLDPTQVDPETERFRMLHGRLHDAVFAVIDASEGEIRYLI